MSERQLAYALILVGIVAALVSVLADTLGIGGSDEFGYLQIIGLVAGVVVALTAHSGLFPPPPHDVAAHPLTRHNPRAVIAPARSFRWFVATME